MQDISTYMFFSFSQKLLFSNAVHFGKSTSLVLLTTYILELSYISFYFVDKAT